MYTRYTELINRLKKDGYTMEDIDAIIRLRAEYAKECEKIADQCVEEGYPSNGSNYELRCADARKYYDEQIKIIDANYYFEE